MKLKGKKRIIATAMAVLTAFSTVMYGNIGPIENVSAAEATATITTPIQVTTKCDFDASKDWSEVTYEPNASGEYPTEIPASLTTTEPLNKGTTVETEVWLDKDASFTGSIKVQGVARLGSSWSWTPADNISELKLDDFTVKTRNGEEYKVAKVTHTFDDDDIEADALMGYTYKVAGCNCTYTGSLRLANIVLTNGSSSSDDSSQAGEVITEITDLIQLYDTDVTFTPDKDWDDKGEYEISMSTDAALKSGAKITLELLLPKDATYDGILKLQGVVKIGNGWTWTEFPAIAEFKSDDFVEDGEYKKAEVTYTGDPLTTDAIKAFFVKAAGYQCNYSGPIYVRNVKLYDGTSGGSTLIPTDDKVLSDLSSEADYGNWSTENGSGYHNGNDDNDGNAMPVIAYDSDNERLKVTLDYSADSASTWSEAKVKYTPSEAVDVSQYNQLSVDFIYPDSLDGSKMKFFANGIISKDVVIDDSGAEDLGNGMKKVTVTMGFSPTSTKLESVTIGLVGYLTSFKGDVYLDNLVLSQKDSTSDYVKITSEVGTGSPANISAPSEITVSDAQAESCAKALFAYLKALTNSEQVLFGHQNDVNKSVNPQAEYGDVYDITGQVSGVYGIDSLSLTNTEAGGTDAASALAKSVEYSKTAAANGAIVSLSMHMPNFSNEKVVKNADGSYSFFGCDFDESKDLSNDIAKQILPGGEYNDAFNDYLDIIVDYATQLQDDDIPILFRPFHENTGNWFWWGSMNTVETYKSLFRYTKDYMEEKGVHNMLYVYSPGGPVLSEEEYLTYYPGDEYVDILAFDYYDDYSSASASSTFLTNLDTTCNVVSTLAAKRGKLAAISECGVRVTKTDGTNEGLLVKGNPIGTDSAAGTNWYMEVSNIAKKHNMPYYLVWANFGESNFYVPYKYDDTYGQELINDFIDYFNDSSSIFGGDTGFYTTYRSTLANVSTKTYTNQMGYMVAPFDMDAILGESVIKAKVKNASTVQFVINNPTTGVNMILTASNSVNDAIFSAREVNASASSTLYTATLTADNLATLGKTDVATITLLADGKEIAKLSNISLGKEKDKAPAYILEDFEYYSGSNGLLDVTYTSNSAPGCSSSFVLDTEHKNGGTYGGAFKYKLVDAGSEVWTGRIKADLVSGDLSAYNALEMWVQPDGKGQKLVIQLTDSSGEEFEVYLTDFVKGTKAQYVTIPFSSFKGKDGGTLDTANITKFAVWCNSIVPEGHSGEWVVDSTIYFDGIIAVNLSDEILAANPVDKNGLIITDESLVKKATDEDPSGDVPAEVSTESTSEATTGSSTGSSTESTTEVATGSTTGTSNNDDTAKTGDASPLSVVVVLMCLSAALAAYGAVALRKKKRI